MKPKIGVVLPSRGLIFAETEDALFRNLAGYEYKIYRSWDLVIPDCQNILVDKALLDNPTHLFFVEEDVVIPDGALSRLLAANVDIACLDYGVSGWGCVTRDSTGKVLWCGLGATLVKKEVFSKLDKPYFRSDVELRLNDWQWIPSPPDKYGGQDIYFCCQARKKGFEITQVEGECRHLRLDRLGQREINNGLHQISDKPKIERKQILNEKN